ncbi:MAG TPA: hypothetical protein VFB81_17525, partial [Myxococcales bacterium]|nr:hypothetical protein [Myxococcales bacterium]
DSGQLALAFSSRLTDRATVATQVDLHADQRGIEVDWVFGEWKFSDQVRLQVGIFKHPLGLYGEVIDVGTLHPFGHLPPGIYGPTELVVEGVKGVGLNGAAYDRDGWTLSYDAYLGALEYLVDEPFDRLLAPQSLQPGRALELEDEDARETLGGRLTLVTPVEGLSFRLSGYGNWVRSDETGPRWVLGPSVEYASDRLTVQAEYFHRHDVGVLRIHTGYVLASYFLTEHLQVALRGEVSETELLALTEWSPLLRHRELAAGVNWWFTPSLVVKLSIHGIDGNRLAKPEMLDDALLDGTLAPTTVAVFGGTSFSF